FVWQSIQVEGNKAVADQYAIEEHPGGEFLQGPGLPDGFQPGYKVEPTGLQLSSHATTRTMNGTGPGLASPALIRIAVPAVRDQLKTHRQALAQWIAARQTRPKAEILADLEQLHKVLEVFERVELRQTATGKITSWELQFQFIEPIRK
ncbi:MAG: hypothetical protein ACRCZF_21575, partial [Gemmataceae bacterium]